MVEQKREILDIQLSIEQDLEDRSNYINYLIQELEYQDQVSEEAYNELLNLALKLAPLLI